MARENFDACYFCTTPFQILSSLSLVKSMKEKADLYIMPQFSAAETYAERIEATEAFRRVKVVDEQRIIHTYMKSANHFINHLEIARSYLFIDDIAKEVLIPDTQYNKMYVSSRAYIGRTVQMYFLKHGVDTEIVYFDDGEGSYVNEATYKPRKTDAIVRGILFGKKANDTNHAKYLYSPAFYHLLNPGTEREDVRLLPSFCGSAEQKDYINSIFHYSPDQTIPGDFIILDTLREGFKPEFNRFILGLYGDICRCAKERSVTVKRHPRDTSPKEEGYIYYTNTEIPYEVLCMNMDLDHKVLVAISSTATVIPKLILNQEPYVIMLYKLTDHFLGQSLSARRYYEECRNLYTHKERFMIPETIDEYHEMLRSLKPVVDSWHSLGKSYN